MSKSSAEKSWFGITMLVVFYKMINLIWLAIALKSWRVGISVVPFFIFGNLQLSTWGNLLFGEKRAWGLVVLNLLIFCPALFWLFNWLVEGRGFSFMRSVWVAS